MLDLKKLKRAGLGLLPLVLVATLQPTSADSEYQSPYKLEFSVPIEELYTPDRQPPRDNPKLESAMPFDEWYSKRTERKFGSWGPLPRHFPPLEGLERIPPAWKRQRVLAVGATLIGLPYQHHHIPDWDPPARWPWKEVAYGRNSKGMDCSDFTSWCYNYGLGLHMTSDTQRQAALTEVHGPGDRVIEPKVIQNNNGYDDLVSRLKSGDLLFIKRSPSGTISHVIMWVGEYGHSPDHAPLIIDCTGSNHKDSNGTQIPIGVHLRPFTQDSWYYKCFAHANRIIGE